MARKMRLISELDYQVLMNLKKRSTEEELEREKISTLDASVNVPDDVRTILYNDASRRLQKHQIIEANKPLFVTNEKSELVPTNLGINTIKVNAPKVLSSLPTAESSQEVRKKPHRKPTQRGRKANRRPVSTPAPTPGHSGDHGVEKTPSPRRLRSKKSRVSRSCRAQKTMWEKY